MKFGMVMGAIFHFPLPRLMRQKQIESILRHIKWVDN